MATKAQKENQARFKAVQAEAKKLKAKNPKLAHTQAVKQAWAILSPKSGKKKAPAKKAAPKKKVGAVKKKTSVKVEKAKIVVLYPVSGARIVYQSSTKRYVCLIKGKANKYFDYLLDAKDYMRNTLNKSVGKVKAKAPVKKKTAAKKKVAPKSMHKDTQSHNVSIRVMSGVIKDRKSILSKLNQIFSDIGGYEGTIIRINSELPKMSAPEKKRAKEIIKSYKAIVKELKIHGKELYKHVK
jgi:hypothetical protein